MKITRTTKRAGRNEYHAYTAEDDNGKLLAKDLVGVTSLLGILDKPGIPIWTAREAGKAIGLQIKQWIDAPKTGVSTFDLVGLEKIAYEAIKDGYRYAESLKDKAAERGTDGHTIAELIAIEYHNKGHGSLTDDFLISLLRGQPSLAADDTYLIALAVREWFLRVKPVVKATEKMVVCVPCGYGATLDLECEIEDTLAGLMTYPWLIDVKTGKGVYDTVALQVLGQSHALQYTNSGDHYTPTSGHRMGVLWVSMDAKDGCELIETKATMTAFEAVRTSYFWRKSNSWRA